MTKPPIPLVDDEPNLADYVRIILERIQRFAEDRSVLGLSAAHDFPPSMMLLDAGEARAS